ncbi:DUF692 domain-containing protein [Archangium lansingense]|uniref:DUF692 family protein n=1 Tax=Archangium lansingense TaxID=2995310 RepID=A0ABT4AME0_9BACT|nr:DUF692 family multinuclear iron-containing protein [Archangium lansinium]MCY1082858.1 DUF692 family protein [Archangium lansinium]
MAPDRSTPSRAGVGLLFNPALTSFVPAHLQALDHLAVIPDRAWTDRGAGAQPRFQELSAPIALLEHAAESVPLVLHSIGLSVCSADIFDLEYVAQLAAWRERFQCPWASEHLSFSRVGGEHERNASVALPITYDREMMELLVPRLREVSQRLGCPFLVENPVYYVKFRDPELTEPEFFNTLAEATGCGLLLDLHNLYTNARNHGFDAHAYLRELELQHVLEAHVAGGDEMMGFHTDSHVGAVIEPVWELLEDLVGQAPRLRGVTFEFHESSWPLLREEGVLAQLERARAVVRRASVPLQRGDPCP